MASLELKIPPLVFALAIALAMWALSMVTPALDASMGLRVGLALALALGGIAMAMAGAIWFRRFKTTVNPLEPEKASTLVQGGVFSCTRNPMYVGLMLVLAGWVVFLAAPWALLGPVCFCIYISRFQIAPEERVLTGLFGTEYTEYQAKVRRWL